MCPCMFGFQAVGIAAGSCASCFQSCCYGAFTVGGGLFAHCTRAGMTGLGWCCCGSPILTIIWAVITVLGIITAVMYFTGTFLAIKLGVEKLWCQFENLFHSEKKDCSGAQNITTVSASPWTDSYGNFSQTDFIQPQHAALLGPAEESDTKSDESIVMILGMCSMVLLGVLILMLVRRRYRNRRQYSIV